MVEKQICYSPTEINGVPNMSQVATPAEKNATLCPDSVNSTLITWCKQIASIDIVMPWIRRQGSIESITRIEVRKTEFQKVS